MICKHKLNSSEYCYGSLILQLNISCLHTVKWSNSSFSNNSIVCAQFKCQTVLSGATTPCQSEPRGNGNEEVLSIPQSSSITGASPPDDLMSYPGHLLREEGSLSPLQRCSQCILQNQHQITYKSWYAVKPKQPLILTSGTCRQ